jgi:hypothetical protein
VGESAAILLECGTPCYSRDELPWDRGRGTGNSPGVLVAARRCAERLKADDKALQPFRANLHLKHTSQLKTLRIETHG